MALFFSCDLKLRNISALLWKCRCQTLKKVESVQTTSFITTSRATAIDNHNLWPDRLFALIFDGEDSWRKLKREGGPNRRLKTESATGCDEISAALRYVSSHDRFEMFMINRNLFVGGQPKHNLHGQIQIHSAASSFWCSAPMTSYRLPLRHQIFFGSLFDRPSVQTLTLDLHHLTDKSNISENRVWEYNCPL